MTFWPAAHICPYEVSSSFDFSHSTSSTGTERIGEQVDRIVAGVDSADRSYSVSDPLISGE